MTAVYAILPGWRNSLQTFAVSSASREPAVPLIRLGKPGDLRKKRTLFCRHLSSVAEGDLLLELLLTHQPGQSRHHHPAETASKRTSAAPMTSVSSAQLSASSSDPASAGTGCFASGDGAALCVRAEMR